MLTWRYKGRRGAACPVEALKAREMGAGKGERLADCQLVEPAPADASEVLVSWATWCAARVLPLWEPPDSVVRALSAPIDGDRLHGAAYDAWRRTTAAGWPLEDGGGAAGAAAASAWQALRARQEGASGVQALAHGAASSARAAVAIANTGDLVGPGAAETHRREQLAQVAHLIELLARHLAPLPDGAQARLTAERQDRYDRSPLWRLRLGLWWLTGDPDLGAVEVRGWD